MALTFPSSPTNGQVYTDTTTGNRYIYDSSKGLWKYSSNNVGMTVSTTPPSNVAAGAMWFNSSIGRTFVYYNDGDSTQWVETVPAGTVDTNTIAGYVNPVFASMNGAYTTANAAYTTANAAYATQNADYTTTNAAYSTANAAFNAANNVNLSAPYNTANAAFGVANTALQNGSVTLAGSLTTTGSITSSSRGITKGSMPSGSILQVQSTTLSSTFTSASTSYVDLTGMSVSITPTSSTSKILVQVSLNFQGDSSTQGYCQIDRNGTAIAIGDANGARIRFTINQYVNQSNEARTISMTYLDSPATTSALTYKLQLRNQGLGTIYVNRSTTWAADATSGTGISTITVMEIAQ